MGQVVSATLLISNVLDNFEMACQVSKGALLLSVLVLRRVHHSLTHRRPRASRQQRHLPW